MFCTVRVFLSHRAELLYINIIFVTAAALLLATYREVYIPVLLPLRREALRRQAWDPQGDIMVGKGYAKNAKIRNSRLEAESRGRKGLAWTLLKYVQ